MPAPAATIPEILPIDASRSIARSPRRLDILILAGYVRSLDWSESLWAPDLAHALAARGHSIEVAADGVDDPTLFGGLPLTIHRPTRKHFGAEPFAFRRWALSLMSARPQSVCLSLTPMVCGDVWLPVGKRSSEMVGQLFSAHRPLAAAMELLHYPWLFHELFAEYRAARQAPRRRVQPLTIGPHAEGSSLRSLGYAARAAPLTGKAREEARRRVREMLGIGPADLVLLLSGTHARPHTAQNLLAALSMLSRSATASRTAEAPALGDPPPLRLRLLVTGRYPHTLDTLAHQAGCASLLVHAGTRAPIDELLAASDVAIAAFGDAGIGTGRFACEAIRARLPVIAAEDAPGSDLADSGTHKPGAVVREDSPEGWLAVLGKILDERWLDACRAAAASVGADLTTERLVARLESYLLGALR